jgi:hypothetical protein
MKIYKLITFLLAVCLLPFAASCGDSDDFSGTDNYVTSFVVQKAGVAYAATIIGNNINVTVPTDVSLTGSTAICQTSEYATISPDPTTITDWDQAQQIVVTSKNNTPRTYSYTVTKSDISAEGVMILRTQADVNAFAAKKVAVLDGSLMIGEKDASGVTDSIKDISALNTLRQVSGSLTIGNSFAGKDLKGLSNLTDVANLYIGSLSSASGIADSLDVDFPRLVSAGEVVVNFNKAKSVSMAKLDNVYSLYLSSSSMGSLSLDALHQVYGDLTITGNNGHLKTLDLSHLVSINGSLSIANCTALSSIDLTSLKTVGDIMSFSSLISLSTLTTGIESVGGQLTLNALYNLKSVSFSKLKSVGTLYYRGDWSHRPATSFDFSALETVADNIDVDYTSLTAAAFPALTSIGGKLQWEDSEQMTSLSTPKLTACPTIYLSELYKMEALDFSGVSNLKSISIVSPYVLTKLKMPKTVGRIDLNGGSRTSIMVDLEGLETVTEKMALSNYTTLTTAVINHVKSIGTFEQNSGSEATLSFPALETVGTINLALPQLTSLLAPHLTTAASIDWEDFQNETSVDLSSLTTITGALKFYGAGWSGGASGCKLTNINFFSALKKVGSVDIKWCGSLADFSGLKNALSSLSASTWSVSGCKYNPTYQEMTEGKTSSSVKGRGK